MRILWPHNFNPSIPAAGVFMRTTAKGLQNLGVDIQLEYLGDLRSPLSILRARKNLKLMAKDFDIVHAQYGSACALVTSVINDRPSIVTIRGNDWNTCNNNIGFEYWHTRLARLMTKFTINKFDGIIPVSKRIQKELIHHAPNAQFLVQPAPIELSMWPSRIIRSRLNNEKWVLHTNLRRDDPVKQYNLCTKVIDLVNKTTTGVKLRVASNVPHDKMPEFVSSCDVVLCTSESEGWPNSIKEALACNVPFVSTDVSDLAEIANHESSCRVCSDDPELLAQNLYEVLQMSNVKNLRKYVEKMDITASSLKLLSFYEKLLKGF